MLAIIYETPGGPEVLTTAELPVPAPGPEEIIIQVEAAGVSRADILQRQGNYPPPPDASPILGLDVAGRVSAVGARVSTWKLGDRVCALTNGGGYAEFCAVPAAQVLPIPEGWSAVEAATLPENLFTVYDNLVTRARLRPDEVVLAHGGTSGIGTTAIMLARAFGAVPYSTAGSDEKCAAAQSVGAEKAINYRTVDFVAALRELTEGRGADVIVDIVGGTYLERNVAALATEGRLVLLATLGGNSGTLPIGRLMAKRASIIASTLRARTTAEKGAIAQELKREIWPRLPEKQAIQPLIDSVFPLADAAKAHQRMEAGLHVGKIVLAVAVS